MKFNTYKYHPKDTGVTHTFLAGTLVLGSRDTVMLASVVYWNNRAAIARNNKFWVANTLDWWSVQTGMSYPQVKKALASLRASGLVETRQMIFGGKNITHLRISDMGHVFLQAVLPVIALIQIIYTDIAGNHRLAINQWLKPLILESKGRATKAVRLVATLSPQLETIVSYEAPITPSTIEGNKEDEGYTAVGGPVVVQPVPKGVVEPHSCQSSYQTDQQKADQKFDTPSYVMLSEGKVVGSKQVSKYDTLDSPKPVDQVPIKDSLLGATKSAAVTNVDAFIDTDNLEGVVPYGTTPVVPYGTTHNSISNTTSYKTNSKELVHIAGAAHLLKGKVYNKQNIEKLLSDATHGYAYDSKGDAYVVAMSNPPYGIKAGWLAQEYKSQMVKLVVKYVHLNPPSWVMENPDDVPSYEITILTDLYTWSTIAGGSLPQPPKFVTSSITPASLLEVDILKALVVSKLAYQNSHEGYVAPVFIIGDVSLDIGVNAVQIIAPSLFANHLGLPVLAPLGSTLPAHLETEVEADDKLEDLLDDGKTVPVGKKGMVMATTQEKLNEMLASSGPKKKPNKNIPHQLFEFLWREAYLKSCNMGIAPFTNTEVAKVKMLLKKLYALGLLEKDIPDFVAWILAPYEWEDLTSDVKDSMGEKIAPALPHIGYVLKHASLIYNLYLKYSGSLMASGTAIGETIQAMANVVCGPKASIKPNLKDWATTTQIDTAKDYMGSTEGTKAGIKHKKITFKKKTHVKVSTDEEIQDFLSDE